MHKVAPNHYSYMATCNDSGWHGIHLSNDYMLRTHHMCQYSMRKNSDYGIMEMGLDGDKDDAKNT